MTAVPQVVRDAADAWAREHGCRDALGCNQTPLSAFAAGMTAERERLADDVVGYLVDGKVWHPSDVTIIRP